MLGAILRTTNSSLQKGITFCRSIYVKTIMKLLAFIFEQPSYMVCCVNGSFEVAYSVNTDQTALTASLICDSNNLPFHHYHLDSLSCLNKYL